MKEKRFDLKIWRWAFILIGLFGSSLTYAQTKTLTLNQAIEAALKSDSQVMIDLNSLEKAKLSVKNEALSILPQATVEGQLQYVTTDNTNPTGYQIVIEQTVPTPYNLYGQKIETNIKAAIWEQIIEETTLQIDKAEVIYNVSEDYFNILKAKEVIKQQEEAVATYRESAALAQKQLELGKITKPAQLKIENYLNQAEYALEKARSDLDIAQMKLANQTGLKDLSDYQLEEIAVEDIYSNLELTDLQKQALQKRLELQKLSLNIKKAERTWLQSKNNELPAVSFNYNHQKETQSLGLSYDFLNGEFSWLAALQGQDYQSDITSRNSGNTSYFGNEQNYFTLKMSWKLDLGIAVNQTKQNQYSLKNSELDLEKEKQDILLEVKQAYNDYKMAVRQYEVNQKALSYYQKDVEIKKLQAQMGMITCTDLAEAQQDALEARVTAVQSDYQRIIAFQQLKKTTGDLYPITQLTQPKTEENHP